MNVKPFPSCCTSQILENLFYGEMAYPGQSRSERAEDVKSFRDAWDKWWEKDWKRQSSPDCSTICICPLRDRMNVWQLRHRGFKLVGRFQTEPGHGDYYNGVFMRQPERTMKK